MRSPNEIAEGAFLAHARSRRIIFDQLHVKETNPSIGVATDIVYGPQVVDDFSGMSPIKGGMAMQLKNAKIGILVYDPTLRRMISDLLNRNGARVFCTDKDEEIERVHEVIGLDVAVVEVRRGGICLN
jgi:hypothetical protein